MFLNYLWLSLAILTATCDEAHQSETSHEERVGLWFGDFGDGVGDLTGVDVDGVGVDVDGASVTRSQ